MPKKCRAASACKAVGNHPAHKAGLDYRKAAEDGWPLRTSDFGDDCRRNRYPLRYCAIARENRRNPYSSCADRDHALMRLIIINVTFLGEWNEILGIIVGSILTRYRFLRAGLSRPSCNI